MNRTLYTLLAVLMAMVSTAVAGVEELQIPDRTLCAICTGSTHHPPEAPAAYTLMADGTPVYFCSDPCRVEFEGDPTAFYSRALNSVFASDSLGHVEAVCSGRNTPVLLALRDEPGLHRKDLASTLGVPSAELRVMVLQDELAGNDTGLPAGHAWQVADGVITLLGLTPEHPLLLLNPDCTPHSRPVLVE